MPKKKYSRTDNRISIEEFESLLDASDHHETRICLIIAYYTGARHQEILNLQKTDIIESDDGTHYEFMFKTLKRQDNHRRNIPIRLDKPYMNMVKLHIDGTRYGEKLFKSTRQLMNYYLYKARDDSGIELSFHAFRHSIGSKLAYLGSSTIDIATMLGHKRLDTTKHYVDASPTRLKKISDLL